jgi:hypothetical protein
MVIKILLCAVTGILETKFYRKESEKFIRKFAVVTVSPS